MANNPESPTQTPAPSPGVLLAMGVGYTLGGAALLLLALGVIPASDRMFPVGRLVVGLVAACIVLAGVVVLARAAGARSVENALAPALVLLFMTTLSGFFTWALLTDRPPDHSTLGGFGLVLPREVVRTLDRGLLALAVGALDLLTLFLWAFILRGLGRRRA